MTKQLARALGAASNERGASAERRVLLALAEAVSRTEWLRGVWRATPDEDARGIDIVANTDVGHLYLQVKSSQHEAFRFSVRRGKTNRRQPIGVVVCAARQADEEVQRRALDALREVRDEVLKRRS